MLRSCASLKKAPLVSLRGPSVFRKSARAFAENPNDIAKRISSTKSIQKITKSMKTVSAVKLRGDTSRLMEARVFGRAFEQIFTAQPEGQEEFEKTTLGDFKNPLYLMISSDKGLCGGVNGYVAKLIKSSIDSDKAAGKNPNLMILGEKGLALLQRTHSEYIRATIGEATKLPMNFYKCLSIAERVSAVCDAHPEIDGVKIAFNKFRNSISYDTEYKYVPVYPNLLANTSVENPDLPYPFSNYELEFESVEETINNVFEYGLAVQLFGCILESATSEQSSRMTAMENASKNASEMVDSLTIKFNRARQAKITTELIEIISGAESLKD